MLTREKLSQIIATYDNESMTVSKAFGDGGIDPLWARFERAAISQMDEGVATVSRYAIWANTVRDNIVEARQLIQVGRLEAADKLLIRGINSLSAFSDVQAEVDTFFK